MREFITLIENSNKPQDVEIIPLSVEPKEFSPALSMKTIDLHYNTLAHGYAERFNKKEGDPTFNYAGAFLHNTLFPQYREYRNNNKPNGPMIGFINKHFEDYDNFKEIFAKEAMKIQGSGWVYLSYNGTIKTIVNHEVRNDILLLIDWWEHAFLIDYGADKKKYLENQWKIINWNVISTRWGRAIQE